MKIQGLLIWFLMLSGLSATAQITEYGLASYYADKFHGRMTASGETFDQQKMVAAHRTLPFGTKVKVTNVENNHSVVVTIIDRGPFVNDRVIDLSKAAAEKINIISDGVARVKLEVLELPDQTNSTPTEKQEPRVENKPVTATPVTEKPVVTESAKPSAIASEALEYYSVESKLLEPKGWGIQVASYKEAANLIKRCYDLEKEVDKTPIIQVGDNNGTKIYRIILGPFPTREDADAYYKTIQNKFPGCFVLGFN